MATLFFYPLFGILKHFGLPPTPAGVALRLADAYGIKRDKEHLGVSEKTLRNRLAPDNLWPPTENGLFDILEPLCNRVPNNREELYAVRRWQTHSWEWYMFARMSENTDASHELLQTRERIQKLAIIERDLLRREPEAFDPQKPWPEHFLLSTLARIPGEDPQPPAPEEIPSWLLRRRFSLLMDILAILDVEYCAQYLLPEEATMCRRRESSILEPILPVVEQGRLVNPLARLFCLWCKRFALDTPTLAAVFFGSDTASNDPDRLRQVRAWRSGDKRAHPDMVAQLIRWARKECDEGPEWAQYMKERYLLAYGLTGLCNELLKGADEAKGGLPRMQPEQIPDLFEPFRLHRKAHLASWSSPRTQATA